MTYKYVQTKYRYTINMLAYKIKCKIKKKIDI